MIGKIAKRREQRFFRREMRKEDFFPARSASCITPYLYGKIYMNKGG